MEITRLAPTRLPADYRDTLRLLYVAKHAHWQGGLHPEDGNHAPYHREIRQRLEDLGIALTVADDYDIMFDRPDVDFVFPMLNRGGFFNSEMLLPLLCNRLDLPYLGASPILRGLADDKHLTKLEAAARRVPTAPWALFRRGAPVDVARCPAAARWVVKPNNSSASWGVRDAHDLDQLEQAISEIHAMDHDALVEPFITGSDVEVPVITQKGEPVILPMMIFEQEDPDQLRTYAQKRDLDGDAGYAIVRLQDPIVHQQLVEYTRQMIDVFRPFDFGRFEFRMDYQTGKISFLEVNLNCNLWSEKLFARSALAAGLSHGDLIETILAESMMRQIGLEGRQRRAA